MADPSKMVIDVDAEPYPYDQHPPRKTLKRKRSSSTSTPLPFNLTIDQKTAQIEALNKELEGLFGYYEQVVNRKMGFEFSLDLRGNDCNTLNGMVGLLMEESDLPLSKLVEMIYRKLAGERLKENVSVTVAVVKSAVLFVGQRVMYGVPNVDADVLEDDNQSCLWCWETRDLKLMPKYVRGALTIRRMCRKKIHERISAVYAMLSALQKSDSDHTCRTDLMKASEKLGKVLHEADIRLLVDNMLQKHGAEMADKEAKREQKLLIKQLVKNKKEAEKEKRQTEKEQKRLQEEADKDEKRREKEESEMRRQLRKQQEEADKEQRRREKEEAELKKRIAIQKQASIMERFLNRSKSASPCQSDKASTELPTSDLTSKYSAKMPGAVTVTMDCSLSSNDNLRFDDIRKLHLSSWKQLGHAIRSNKKQHWSIRQKPKIELFKELKLTAARELAHDDGSVEKLVSRWEEQSFDDRSFETNVESSPDCKKWIRRKQFLQFDKSYRPAFFGIWPKKSNVIGPRHPFRKDPHLDYDIDSDEEWEEEDPGESLSDCDKDDEEQSLEEGCSKDDEEESEDGFFVPDGYLSENEGVQLERMETDLSVEGRGSQNYKQDLQNEEFCTLLQQQKYLNNLTETALRKNQPLIILNLMHEKVPLLFAEDLTGTEKLEKMCLEALSMRAFPGGLPMEISTVNIQAEDQDVYCSSSKAVSTHISTSTIQESDIPIIVSAIQSCSHSINKVVESLQQKFPTVPKSQLRSKVREISDFVDNQWQVKKEILDEVGISISPAKGRRGMQNISTFFSKRCLPPAGKSMNPNESSPQSSLKSGPAEEGQQAFTCSHL